MKVCTYVDMKAKLTVLTSGRLKADYC